MNSNHTGLGRLGIGLFCFVAATFCIPGTLLAQSQDTPGSQDHPLISRYKGSLIDGYDARNYDRFVLVLGKPKRGGMGAAGAEKIQELEGKVTRILDSTPGARSAFEIFKNYEMALQNAGFKTLYKCLPEECTNRMVFVVYPPNRKLAKVEKRNGRFDLADEFHYLAAKASTPKGNVYVSLMVATDRRPRFSPTTLLEVIETKEMDTGMVSVNADAIGEGLDKSGHIAIYGIYFDTGSNQIKPESAVTIAEITKLLGQKPALKLLVVGHTDNQGGYDVNMDLSSRRAASVVKALVAQGVAPGRLRPAGVGYLSPVANNDSEDGRAKNRRVELVKQ
jgi:OOP family OmpA-OmpF porin